MYVVVFERFEEAGDHVEFRMCVTHRSSRTWRAWRRFSEFVDLHRALAEDLGPAGQPRLPAPPQKSWLPSFAQTLDGDFCQQRLQDLQRYLEEVLADPALTAHGAVQRALGVQAPEPPAGVRVARRDRAHELEIRPATEGEANPVDGYRIEICHETSGSKYGITHQVGAYGMQVQRARIGRLASGEYSFTVVATNFAGESASITVPVIIEQAPDDPQSLNGNRCSDAPAAPLPEAPSARQSAATALVVRGAAFPKAGSNMGRGASSEMVSQIGGGRWSQPLSDALSAPAWPRSTQLGAQRLGESRAPTCPPGQTAPLTRQASAPSGVRSGVSPAAELPADRRSYLHTPSRNPHQVVGRPNFMEWREPTRPEAHQSMRAEGLIGPLSGVPGPSPRPPSGEEPPSEEECCVVCLSERKSHAFVPCGHRCVCESCCQSIMQSSGASCPVCRGQVRAAMQIWI